MEIFRVICIEVVTEVEVVEVEEFSKEKKKRAKNRIIGNADFEGKGQEEA